MAWERHTQRRDWFSAAQARDFGQTIVGDLATKIILEHLKGKKLTAYAASWSREAYGSYDVESYDGEVEIPAHVWNDLQDDFWTTGIAVFFRPSGNAVERSVTYRYYGVRFSTLDITKLFPGPAPTPPGVTTIAKSAASRAPVAPDAKLKPVAEAHLKAWAQVFLKAYGNTDFAEPFALKSAQGMFPDKSVGRDRVREVLGPRKRGPKPKINRD